MTEMENVCKMNKDFLRVSHNGLMDGILESFWKLKVPATQQFELTGCVTKEMFLPF